LARRKVNHRPCQASVAGSRQYHRDRSPTRSVYFESLSNIARNRLRFCLDTRGNIITNFHVIQNADTAQVTLADQSNWKAQVVGVAADKDLAVLRIDAPPNRLRPIPLGTSKELQVARPSLPSAILSDSTNR
jgi:S1-C subfamily serine protease